MDTPWPYRHWTLSNRDLSRRGLHGETRPFRVKPSENSDVAKLHMEWDLFNHHRAAQNPDIVWKPHDFYTANRMTHATHLRFIPTRYEDSIAFGYYFASICDAMRFLVALERHCERYIQWLENERRRLNEGNHSSPQGFLY